MAEKKTTKKTTATKSRSTKKTAAKKTTTSRSKKPAPVKNVELATAAPPPPAVKDRKKVRVTLKREERCRYGALKLVLTPGKTLTVSKEVAAWLIATNRCV